MVHWLCVGQIQFLAGKTLVCESVDADAMVCASEVESLLMLTQWFVLQRLKACDRWYGGTVAGRVHANVAST